MHRHMTFPSKDRLFPVLTFAAFIFLFSLPCSDADSREIRVGYSFSSPSIVTDAEGFTTVSFENTRQTGRTGEPSYPYRGVRVLLPRGETAASFRFERSGWKPLRKGLILHPKQRSVPGIMLSADDPALAGAGGYALDGASGRSVPPVVVDRFQFSRAAYERDEWVDPPAGRLEVHYLRGHAIATGTFTPVAYNPAGKETGYYSDVTLVIETSPSAADRSVAGGPHVDERTLDRVSLIVDNPESVPPSAVTTGSALSTPLACDYLIVTSGELEASFVPLRDFYNRRGLKTRILTIEEIDTWFRGRDLCEKVRTAIVQHYSDYGIEYVLLGGDVQVVPYRGFTCTVDSEGALEPDEELPATIRVDNRIPADIYFSNLDGDWNDDGDILWGEPGEEDFYSEIAVGRACVNTQAEAAIFVHKTTMYQEYPVTEHLRRVLLLGENLTNEPLTWGADDLEELIDTCQAHDYSTTGVPPDFDITTYFDRDISTWSGIDVVAPEVNAGTHWIFHVGHCNTSYGLRLGINAITVQAFSNDGAGQNYPVINTVGCLLGSFELNDCIAERIVGIDNFALAMVCNSRFGWFTPGSTNGVSHHYQREFVDAIFGDGITRLGPAHARSKDDTAVYLTLPGYAEEGVMRWCFYCLNLLGDPAADTWTDTPAPIAAVHEGAIESSDATYMVSTGVPGCTGTLSWCGDLFASAQADESGTIVISLAGMIPSDRDSLVLCLSAHDCLPRSETVTVHHLSGPGETPSAAALLECSPNPFNPSATIRFSVARQGRVDMRVYDAGGREIAILLGDEMEPGAYDLVWSPTGVSSGVYFCVLRTAGISRTLKIVLMR